MREEVIFFSPSTSVLETFLDRYHDFLGSCSRSYRLMWTLCCIRIMCYVLVDRGDSRIIRHKLIIECVTISVSTVSTYLSHFWYSVLGTMKQQQHIEWLNNFVKLFFLSV